MPTKTMTVTKPVKNALQSEILEYISKAKTKADKIKLLQEQKENQALVALLVWNFDPNVKSALPEGEVPFTRNEAPKGTEHTVLAREYRNLYKYCEGGDASLTRNRREMLFIQLLEGLHEDEADLLCLVKDKKLGTKYKITYPIVQEAFPERQWG